MTRTAILKTAADFVSRDRHAQHGEAESNLGLIASLWSAYLGIEITSSNVAALMVLLKMARAKGNPGNMDSWVDAAGYAALGGELAPE